MEVFSSCFENEAGLPCAHAQAATATCKNAQSKKQSSERGHDDKMAKSSLCCSTKDSTALLQVFTLAY